MIQRDLHLAPGPRRGRNVLRIQTILLHQLRGVAALGKRIPYADHGESNPEGYSLLPIFPTDFTGTAARVIQCRLAPLSATLAHCHARQYDTNEYRMDCA